MIIHQRLCHAVFNPQLEKTHDGAQTGVKDLEKWDLKNHDDEITDLSDLFKPAEYLPV